MSGRQLNGWGDCVYCGETLKPEDKRNTSDHCPFCLKWLEVAQIAIDRRFYAEKQLIKAEKEKNQKAAEYWLNKEASYREIHKTLIVALSIKRKKLYHETY